MPVWSPLEWLEALSYLVTIVGLPFAIGVFLFEQREERQNEEESIYQNLRTSTPTFCAWCLNMPTCSCAPNRAPRR